MDYSDLVLQIKYFLSLFVMDIQILTQNNLYSFWKNLTEGHRILIV